MIDYVDPSDVALEVARRHVETFSNKDDSTPGLHKAMQRAEFEDFLDAGIRAYKWLRNAELTLQEAARQGIEIPEEVVAALKSLYFAWQMPRRHAEDRIRELESAGVQLSNQAEFRRACDGARARLQALETYDAIDDAFAGRVFDEEFVRTIDQLIDS